MKPTPTAAVIATLAVAAALAAPNTNAAAASHTAGHAASAHGHHPTTGKSTARPAEDQKSVGSDLNGGKSLPIRRGIAAASDTPQANSNVGDTKTFLAEDEFNQELYVKDYTLRGIGDHIEVWVADDRAFPDPDCRNDLGLTDITDPQVATFIDQFDGNIYPKESASFSTPPDLDGANAPLASILGLPDDYYQVEPDQADDIVVLVDNVRDANYYAPTTPDGQTFIAGFFSSQFNDLTNRNVMTIDAYDWLHRTGATPPDNSGDAAYQACTTEIGSSRPIGVPHPFDYEGTFAHEYQHLLEHYQDPDEVNWVNEGLSDYAQTLTGYVDATVPPKSPDVDGHIGCFEGYLPRSLGGPENSLTLWGDQGAPEILCDYGATYTFMLYLFSHYGEDFMSALHHAPGNGIDGLRQVLEQSAISTTPRQLINRWAATVAVDHAIDAHGLRGRGNPDDYTADALNGSIRWGNPQAYRDPGAPPNGSDYVRLRDASGYLSASDVDDITFEGSTNVPPLPLEWTVDNAPPTATAADTECGNIPDGAAPAALYSGCGASLDRSMVRQVDVPASGGQLSFQTLFDTEEDWDYGYVQISSNGGRTWHSLSTEDTTTDHDPDAQALAVENLPGFTGDSGTWLTEHADLSKYAGKSVLIGFRYITDELENEGGFWVRDISVAGTTLPSDSLAGWESQTEAHPQVVPSWSVQLVTIGKDGARVAKLPLDGNFSGSLSGAALRKAVGNSAALVAAIVTLDDLPEDITQQVSYTLTANGYTQPGGGGS
jgi:hypothetical protein